MIDFDKIGELIRYYKEINRETNYKCLSAKVEQEGSKEKKDRYNVRRCDDAHPISFTFDTKEEADACLEEYNERGRVYRETEYLIMLNGIKDIINKE